MSARKEHPARSLMEPTDSGTLRAGMKVLRANGLSDAEAAAEMLRRNFYDLVDSESDEHSEPCRRLRIIKR